MLWLLAALQLAVIGILVLIYSQLRRTNKIGPPLIWFVADGTGYTLFAVGLLLAAFYAVQVGKQQQELSDSLDRLEHMSGGFHSGR